MIGTRLGAYRVLSELGAGGMGRVYLAEVADEGAALGPGTRVALKVIHPHLLGAAGFLDRFLREARIGERIRHPNVVRTHACDAAVAEGRRQHFLVMEYVQGQTLRALLEELERVPEELCHHVGREIAKGLAAIHAAGAVHRDLKPDNVLITRAHVVKVMDLGVARLVDETLRLSQTGSFEGSLEYAAPEQLHRVAGGPDGRTDLHALGLVLYELATGQHPYRDADARAVLRNVLEKAPRRAGEVNPQLSPFFEEVVHCLLAKDPGHRFPDAEALLGVLEVGETSPWWRTRAREIRATTQRPLRRIRIPRETAVHGRERELAALRALFEEARAGDGRVVFLEGEAGIGKSRLVDELVGRLRRDGEDLDFLFGSYPPGGAASAAGAFSTAFREQLGDEGAEACLAQTPLLVPAFEAVLRGDAPPPGAEPLTKESLATCFVQAARALAAERPTVILIDDLHWAPEEALGLFAALALAVPGHRILLLGAMRPGVDAAWRANLQRLDHVAAMPLDRLFPRDLVELLRESFRSEALATALGAQIALKSDGNPFFAFEIVRGLREAQFIAQHEDGTWIPTRVIDQIQLPSSVLDLVNARVADLTAEERDILDVACCWGFEFDPGLVGDVLGIERIPLLKHFGQIERRHRLVRAAGRHYVFDHHQVQEALYGTLHEQLREEYHAALAAALESRAGAAAQDPATLDGALCVDLCEHHLRGAHGARALRYLAAAQSHLAKGYLHAQVVDLTERALAVPGLLAGVERAQALLRLGAALAMMGRRERQESCAREAERLAEAAGRDDLRAEAARALGVVLHVTARDGEAEAALRRALEIARAREDREAESRALGNLGVVYESQGRLALAREHGEQSLDLCRAIGNRPGEAAALGNLGNAFLFQGRLDAAREHYERCLAIYREMGNRQGEAIATGNLGIVFYDQGRLDAAREHQERYLALSRQIGDRLGEAIATGNLGNLALVQERLAQARAHGQRHLALSREIGHRQGEGNAAVNLGNVLLAEGMLEEAREQQELGLAIGREIGDRHMEAVATVSLGNTLRALGRLGEAREHYERLLGPGREGGHRESRCLGLSGLAAVAYEEDDPRRALGLAEESLALRGSIGSGAGTADALLDLGDLRRRLGDIAGARAALEEALCLCRAQGRPGATALALALRAGLPDGDVADAEAALAEAGPAGETPRVHWMLYQASGDRAHLHAARRLLAEALAKVPAEHREAMRTKLRLHREILGAP